MPWWPWTWDRRSALACGARWWVERYHFDGFVWGYGLRIGGDGEDGNMDSDAMGEGRKSWQHGSGRFSTLEVSEKAGKACWCLVMNTFSTMSNPICSCTQPDSAALEMAEEDILKGCPVLNFQLVPKTRPAYVTPSNNSQARARYRSGATS